MRLKIFLCVGLMLTCLSLATRSDGYHWPLSAPPALTSTFAEHRSGHLHAGIDLKTWGQEGYKVYAVGDGYVWRIRTSPWGYGKALYLRLEDGRTAVYGHLSTFAPSIEQRLQMEQRRQGRYSVDLYLAPHEIPVTEGQVVAISGRTGCAHPHLHFELRDEQDRPLNPLCHGFVVRDGRAPRLTSVSIKPLDWDASVDGEHRRRLYPLQWNASSGHFSISQVPHIEGRAALGLAVHDLADGAENRLNVYALSVFLDGQLHFSTTYQDFSFENADQVDLDTDYELYRFGRGIYHNLYVAPGNDLSFYQPAPVGSGIIDVSASGAGRHHVRIRAQDQSGNAAEAQFSLLLDERPQVKQMQLSGDTPDLQIDVRARDPDGSVSRVWVEISEDMGRQWSPWTAAAVPGEEDLFRACPQRDFAAPLLLRAWAEDELGIRSHPNLGALCSSSETGHEPKFQWQLDYFQDFLEILIHSDRILADEPKVLSNQPGRDPHRVVIYSQGPQQYRGRIPLTGGPDGEAVITIAGRDLAGHLGVAAFTLSVTTITRGQGGVLGDLSTGMKAVFDPQSVYQAFLGRVERVQASSPPGLPMKSPAFALTPDDCVFDEPATVWMTVPQDEVNNARIGVYQLSGNGKWRYLGRFPSEDGLAIGARVKSFSTFALLEDQIEPLIWRLRPKDGSRTGQRSPVLSANVRDSGSGIGSEEDVILKLDGQKLISRYDPPIEAVFYQPQEPLMLGQHLLEVIVRDRAGNQSHRTSRFTVIP